MTTKPVVRTVRDRADFTGTLEAAQSAELRARITGTIRPVEFEEGEIVEKDKLLFLIEPEPFEAALEGAQGQLSQAKAQAQLAEANRARAELLLPRGSVTQQEYDTRAAEAAVADAAVEVQKAAVRQAEIDLSYTRITAPFRGRVGRRLVDAGNLVSGSASTVLTTLEEVDPIYAYFDVGETVILPYLRERSKGTSRKQTPVYLALADEDQFVHKGFINFLDNTIDPATGTVLVRGEFKNPTGLLYPGLFVRVRIPLEPIENAILVEQAALGTDLGGRYVLTVGDNNIVQQKYVELGPQFGLYQVVASGLSADDVYIVEGVQYARPGMPVAPTPAKSRPELKLEAGATVGADEGAASTEGGEPVAEPPATEIRAPVPEAEAPTTPETRSAADAPPSTETTSDTPSES
jgi:multidrug efflux system membrane fusion protein